jgi:hypothetical protein
MNYNQGGFGGYPQQQQQQQNYNQGYPNQGYGQQGGYPQQQQGFGSAPMGGQMQGHTGGQMSGQMSGYPNQMGQQYPNQMGSQMSNYGSSNMGGMSSPQMGGGSMGSNMGMSSPQMGGGMNMGSNMGGMGGGQTPDLMSLFKMADANGDGRLDYQEMQTLMFLHSHMTGKPMSGAPPGVQDPNSIMTMVNTILSKVRGGSSSQTGMSGGSNSNNTSMFEMMLTNAAKSFITSQFGSKSAY